MGDVSKSNQREIHYTILQGLLLLGMMFDYSEQWKNPQMASFIFLSLGLFLFAKGFQQILFLIFLVVSLSLDAYHFPNLSNHANFNFFIFLILIPTQFLWVVFKKKPNFQALQQTLQFSILILYFFTLFHKLNWDFFNPAVSCANEKLGAYIRSLPESWTSLRHFCFQASPYLGIVIEGLVPLCLTFKRVRNLGVVFLVLLHFVLAPMGFTDFSSLAMAFAWIFVDPEKIKTENIFKHFRWLALFCCGFELILAPGRIPKGIETHEVLEGGLFVWAYAPFLFQYLSGALFSNSLSLPRNPAYQAFLLVLFFYGFNNYLGLRTAGNFSMFSNLRTEGSSSNHIFLSSNPFKLFDYQEDTVEIIYVSENIKGIYSRMPQIGQKIPRVEFDRVLDVIRRRKKKAAYLTVSYKGQTYQTHHAGRDDNFNFNVSWLEKKLLKFRFLNEKSVQHCQW